MQDYENYTRPQLVEQLSTKAEALDRALESLKEKEERTGRQGIEIANLEKELADAKRLVHEANAIISHKEARAEEDVAMIRQLDLKVKDLETQNARRVEELIAENNELREQNPRECDALGDRINELVDENDRHLATITELEEDLRASRKATGMHHEDTQKQIRERKRLEDEVDVCRAGVVARDTEIAELKKILAARVVTEIGKSVNKDSTNAAMLQTISRKDAEMDAMQATIEYEAEERRLAEGRLEELKEKAAELLHERDHALDQLEKHASREDRLEAELNDEIANRHRIDKRLRDIIKRAAGKLEDKFNKQTSAEWFNFHRGRMAAYETFITMLNEVRIITDEKRRA
jgi:chromosome segregation ATPase